MQQVIISKFTEASPCFGCTKRTPFCHRIGQCELFTDWRARKDAFTRAEQAKRRGYQTARDQRSEQVYKQLKKIIYQGGQKVGDNQETARPEHSFLLHDHAGRIHRNEKGRL